MKQTLPVQLAKALSPQDRDRWMQIWLAQARGPVRNGDLLRAAYARAARQWAIDHGIKVNDLMDDALIASLAFVTDALEQLQIPHAITGSVASSTHSEPVQTMDVDLVLIAQPSKAAALAAALKPKFYVPEDTLTNAARNGGFVNVIDGQTGIKIDLSFVGDDPYLRQCVQRRVRLTIGGHPREFWFVTAEDIILMKLYRRRDTRSAKQWENALGVTRYKGSRMDWKFLVEQARSLGVEQDLIKLRDEAGI